MHRQLFQFSPHFFSSHAVHFAGRNVSESATFYAKHDIFAPNMQRPEM